MRYIDFGDLSFVVTEDGILKFVRCYGFDNSEFVSRRLSVGEFDIAGGTTSGTNRISRSAQTDKFRYVSHTEKGNTLTLIQRSDKVEVKSEYTRYGDTNAVRITQTYRNIGSEELCLTLANTVDIHFGNDASKENKDYYFHKFNNARYTEAMPDVRSFYDMGFQFVNYVYHVENIGNSSSYETLPQGIIENRRDGYFLMFQIESYCGWEYEITASGVDRNYEIHIGGPTSLRHDWNKVLLPGEEYVTVPVTLAGGTSLNDVLAHMTRYRRHIKPSCPADASLPPIYNEYMHFSWDDPNAERIIFNAPFVAATGCKYYIVDCGWHDSKSITDTDSMYHKFGTWYEDRTRFPDGIRSVAEYVRSLGMKFGLWIAPEVVGFGNEKMLSYYDDDCFFIRNGKRVCHSTGYLLDFRNPKVYNYLSETLDRMIDEYGCDYIKYDGCPNPGFGTELDGTSLGDGLEKAYEAFLKFTEEAMRRHPNVIFEDCAGGGQRMDYKALSMFSLISTSDNSDYLNYPYISANINASVLPEQAAVWSYPVGVDTYAGKSESEINASAEEINAEISKERVVFNMVNSLLSRVHLASRLYLLDSEKRELVREGIAVYNRIVSDKLKAVPYLPRGYASHGDEFVCSGIKTDEKLYLALWHKGGEKKIKIELPEITVKSATVAYPATLPTEFSYDETSLTVEFTEDIQARFFEIELK